MAGKSMHDDDEDDFVEDSDSWSDDSDENEVSDDMVAAGFLKNGHRQRDWRDMERYREERELRKLMQEDFFLDDDEPRWSRH